MKNSGYKHGHQKEVADVEDGEIIDDLLEGKDRKKKKRKEEGDSGFSSTSSSSSKKQKLSASQAYKLDAEERLLLGYSKDGGGGSSSSKSSSIGHSKHEKPSSSSSSSSSHRDRDTHRRPRSVSPPPKPRLAPPRDVYRNSYSRFQKEREHEYEHSRSQSSRYDSASYCDYHAQRGKSSVSSARWGFGYVGKSYYYDDVEEEEEYRRSSDRDRDRDRDRGRDRDSNRSSSSASTSSSWRHRHRSRSRSPMRRSYYHPDDIIDKGELLDIARKNAKKLMSRGVMPSDIFSRDQILALKAGGKSVEELTMYCKRLAKRDAKGDARGSDTEMSGDDEDDHFIHHPFQVKDKPLPMIRLNIRNAVPLPLRTPQELAIESAKLRTQFPVSSGTQHRYKEIEWKPVAEDEKKEGDPSSMALVPLEGGGGTSSATGPNVATVAPMMKEDLEGEGSNDSLPEVNSSSGNSSELKAIEAGSASSSSSNAKSEKKKDEESSGISVDGPDLPLVDISSVIGLRLKAMRMLQENPTSGDAQRQLDDATQMMKHWADAKALEPKFLTPAELSSGPQAWTKRDQLRKTRALDSGMGMHLLQKMGWRPGEGLGKNKEGQLEPLALDVKTDKKGLTAAVEELMYGKSKGSGFGGPSMPVVYDLSGKHPVSALMELTAKRRWGAPEFELCFEHGPPHKRQFVYKVIVNGVEYQPCIAVGNKKQAKSNAAAFCLQSLGLLPTASASGGPPSEQLQTVENGGVQEPISSSSCGSAAENAAALQQSFSSGSFLQTVPQSAPGPVGGGFSLERELMPPPPCPPPPPVPPPLMQFLNNK